MGRFVKGDVVVIPFPFSDLSSSKKRPALVLVDLNGKDIILCQITSKNVKDNNSITVELNDIENGTLNTVSNIRPNRLFTADENIVDYKIGNLNESKIKSVIKAIVDMFED
ncbi:MAG: type II toxin-antitoxin system PemK/MazF family toxin [Oscillospiraceae bacterium]|nr:type II toxin-antitoxin system PemK/MazF family toxin [Oscillospiraceae bacterium]